MNMLYVEDEDMLEVFVGFPGGVVMKLLDIWFGVQKGNI